MKNMPNAGSDNFFIETRSVILSGYLNLTDQKCQIRYEYLFVVQIYFWKLLDLIWKLFLYLNISIKYEYAVADLSKNWI